jgi:hypothetical protein
MTIPQYTLICIYMQLFQLRLSRSKVEKSSTSAKGLLGIAKKLMLKNYKVISYEIPRLRFFYTVCPKKRLPFEVKR